MKLMVIADASGLPLALRTASATPHKVTLIQATLDATFTVGRPRRIIGDRAYDSDPLDKALAAQGIELIAPHRCNRKRTATQDGPPVRRYRPEGGMIVFVAQQVQAYNCLLGSRS